MKEKSILQQALYYLRDQEPFLGCLLQQLNFQSSTQIPTAALCYDKESSKFDVIVNDEFFAKLELKQRIAVLFHEVLHFTHGHLFRFENIGDKKDHKLKNIAADMAINQYINDLPMGCDQCPPQGKCPNENCVRCVSHKDWKQPDGTPFPDFQGMEVYYELLKQTTHTPEDGNGDEPQGTPQDQKTKNGEKNAQGEKGQQANWNKYKNYKEFDEHDWDELSDEEKQRLLQEAKRVFTRAIDNAEKHCTTIPDAVKDLLQRIDAQIKRLDYKAILRKAIKKTLTTQDRKGTWHRPNKRYGSYAPGTTYDKAPFINIYIDTSGSITHTELNEFLQVMDGFLKNSAKKCKLVFWHTNTYGDMTYKLGKTLNTKDIQSGGTEPECVLKHIEENKPNLSIILTDGHFFGKRRETTPHTFWIISRGGNENHQYKRGDNTIKMEGLAT